MSIIISKFRFNITGAAHCYRVVWWLKSAFLVGLVAVSFLSVQISEAADWYLDASAKGANNGKSWANAWASPANIVQENLKPGDILWIQGGNYNADLKLNGRHGVSLLIAKNVTQQAIFTELSLYDCDNFTIDGLLNNTQWIKFTSYALVQQSMIITLRGLEINRENDYLKDSEQKHAVWLWGGCGRVTVDSCVIKNTTGDGINIIQGDYTGAKDDDFDWFNIKNCTIINIGDDGIQAGSPHHITVSNCIIDKNGFPTYFGGHPDGFQLNPDGYKVKIYNNIIKGFNQNVFIEYALSDIFIYNNIFEGTIKIGTDRAINHSVRSSFSGSFLISNNIMFNFLTYYAWNGGVPANAIVGNNIFLNCKYLVTGNTALLLDNTNIYYDLPKVQYYTTEGDAVKAPENRNTGNSIYIDPKFASLDNFMLQNSSPAIGKGKDFSKYFNYDRNYIRRNSVWDIGPYQYSGAIKPPVGIMVSPTLKETP